MDLTDSIAPKSDQINAEDLLSGPRTFTIEKVTAGSSEQPVNVHLREFPGRPYRPSKSMRRVMVAAWGPEASAYAGQRLTLYRDPEVKFGGEKVGGIKISHMSGVDKRLSLALTVTRGKRAPHIVEPLPADAPTTHTEPSPDEIAACADENELRDMWGKASAGTRKLIEDRVSELRAHADAPPAEAEEEPSE